MYFLNKELIFPDPDEADYDGLLAVGGDLSAERLMRAYTAGIFPWFNEDEPILWWSPDPRMVLLFDNLIVSKSMKSVLRKGVFEITFNRDFEGVISNCQKSVRKGQSGTWLTDEMKHAYLELHRLGYAKSVEAWQNGELVGGLYGIDLGNVFCGESMFSKVSNASKAAFITLAKKLQAENYLLVDCQIYNDHLASLGCTEIPRSLFLKALEIKKSHS